MQRPPTAGDAQAAQPRSAEDYARIFGGSGRTGTIASTNCAIVAYQSSMQRSPPVRRRGSGAVTLMRRGEGPLTTLKRRSGPRQPMLGAAESGYFILDFYQLTAARRAAPLALFRSAVSNPSRNQAIATGKVRLDDGGATSSGPTRRSVSAFWLRTGRLRIEFRCDAPP